MLLWGSLETPQQEMILMSTYISLWRTVKDNLSNIIQYAHCQFIYKGKDSEIMHLIFYLKLMKLGDEVSNACCLAC